MSFFSRRYEQRFRERRMALFHRLTIDLSRPVTILDVGGTVEFWHECREQFDITCLNIFEQPSKWRRTSLIGDACDLSRFEDRSFDVVFTNSTIGHVGGWERQKMMAHEIRRVGRAYFVQTPNQRFPIDWRTMTPFFHWLSPASQAWCLTRFRVGRYSRVDPGTAVRLATRIRNLTEPEMRQLFPEATIQHEKFGGLTKSFIAHHGFRNGCVSHDSKARCRQPVF